jgi:hypothetical protein
MPWLPELFTAPALARIWEDERRRRLELVPFFAGLLTGETSALVESFAGEPELHHPVRGRIKGVAAFERFLTDTRDWLAQRDATVEDVDFVIAGGRGVEEHILHLGGIELPVAIASDHDERGQIVEQRMYFSAFPLTGAHAIRPPVLQPPGDVRPAIAVADHHGGGVELEHCAVTDDGRACALEYNVVAFGGRPVPPQAGLAVYVRGDEGGVTAARIYDDATPPRSQHDDA